jgi:predicted  nucleic acid-binding Zn-ribbon protein
MNLLKLVNLQEIDKRLMELELLKGDLPDQIEDLRSRFVKLKEQLLKNKQDLEETKKLSRSIELDVQSLSARLKKYQDQLYSVKTNKEYDAITSEIESLEQRIDETELKGVELLEREEKLTADVSRLDEQMSQVEQLLNKNEFELRERLNLSEAEQKVLMSERNNVISSIDRRFLANYERIRRGKDGVALAEIKNYTCNACYATIPAQTVVEVRKMDRLISCEVCGRILIVLNNHVDKPTEANLKDI